MYFAICHITLRLIILFQLGKQVQIFWENEYRFLSQNEIDKDYEYKDKEYSQRA